MLKKPQVKGCFIQGQFQHGQSENLLSVRHKHNGNLIAEMYKAGSCQIEFALNAAEKGSQALALLEEKAFEVGLHEYAHQFISHKDELIDIITTETGKPEGYANVEVDRCVNVVTQAASSVMSHACDQTKTVLMISPFSIPLDQMLDHICKALSQGCSIILKPSSKSPLTALLLASLLAKTSLPMSLLQVVNCDSTLAEALASNARIAKVTFIGSEKVASRLSQTVFEKEVYIQTGSRKTVIFNASETSNHQNRLISESSEINKIGKYIDDIFDQETAEFDDLSLEHYMLHESALLTSAALRHSYA